MHVEFSSLSSISVKLAGHVRHIDPPGTAWGSLTVYVYRVNVSGKGVQRGGRALRDSLHG